MPVGLLLFALFWLLFMPIFYYKVFLPCWECYDFQAPSRHTHVLMHATSRCARTAPFLCTSRPLPPHRSMGRRAALVCSAASARWRPAHVHGRLCTAAARAERRTRRRAAECRLEARRGLPRGGRAAAVGRRVSALRSSQLLLQLSIRTASKS